MDEFQSLLQTIQRLFNIQCSNYKEDYIKRRLASRMNSRRIPTYKEYQEYLLKNKEEHEALKNALTINVTKFFRDPPVFEVVKTEIFSPILRKKKKLRLWSAGCSSGEEPYSYAIMLYDLTAIQKDVDWMVIATDIDDTILRKAKEGVYEKTSLELVSESQLRRHFKQRDDGKYEIKPHIREKVKFQHHDLMSGVPASRFFDVVSCRNVTIYFNDRQKTDLVHMFYQGLSPGGYYVMGMSEFLSREVEDLFAPFRPLQKIFVRKDTK
ncbi:MAG: protein-glutamate O-methyltransferase CheR [Methanolinea sp.]|jgi:chemotaxis protein methyltransferase CheR|nr:protein-glutamate O-methyltransferase CheR [Methanolinea sp.]